MASGGGGADAAAAAMRASEMEKLNVEQLKALKEQSEMEVNVLQDSLSKIKTAVTRLDIASNALLDLSLRPQGNQSITPLPLFRKMLVPLTASLYVSGTLEDADRVLVDVGTGYFIEKTTAEGKDYCDRKISLLKSNYDELMEVCLPKKLMRFKITMKSDLVYLFLYVISNGTEYGPTIFSLLSCRAQMYNSLGST
ncbi:putative prefoldin subunit 5 [Acorus calamus]|uniref:Prefoldin subunit 5 n=1 Tax=Acorus calamus TaxID=4465 RepID=A0AAV9D627_ACOCL|nr:putative prefoldin subunit 5 [Acorus calamus]